MSETNTYMMVGERLCMDFINTVSWRESTDNRRREWFTNYEKLVDWSIHAGILTKKQADGVLLKAKQNPDEAEEVLKQAIQLREAMYKLFRSKAKGERLDSHCLSTFNDAVARYYQSMHLVPEEDHFSLQFHGQEDTLDQMLPPIVQSAIELLVSEKELDRIKQCEGDPCGWLFYDTSRNRSRRWCSMADCGNRAKARRFYKNKK